MSHSPILSSPIFTDTQKMYMALCTDCCLFANFLAFTCIMVCQNFPTPNISCVLYMLCMFLLHNIQHLCSYRIAIGLFSKDSFDELALSNWKILTNPKSTKRLLIFSTLVVGFHNYFALAAPYMV